MFIKFSLCWKMTSTEHGKNDPFIADLTTTEPLALTS